MLLTICGSSWRCLSGLRVKLKWAVCLYLLFRTVLLRILLLWLHWTLRLRLLCRLSRRWSLSVSLHCWLWVILLIWLVLRWLVKWSLIISCYSRGYLLWCLLLLWCWLLALAWSVCVCCWTTACWLLCCLSRKIVIQIWQCR